MYACAGDCGKLLHVGGTCSDCASKQKAARLGVEVYPCACKQTEGIDGLLFGLKFPHGHGQVRCFTARMKTVDEMQQQPNVTDDEVELALAGWSKAKIGENPRTWMRRALEASKGAEDLDLTGVPIEDIQHTQDKIAEIFGVTPESVDAARHALADHMQSHLLQKRESECCWQAAIVAALNVIERNKFGKDAKQ
jgi:hypothetical protein